MKVQYEHDSYLRPSRPLFWWQEGFSASIIIVIYESLDIRVTVWMFNAILKAAHEVHTWQMTERKKLEKGKRNLSVIHLRFIDARMFSRPFPPSRRDSRVSLDSWVMRGGVVVGAVAEERAGITLHALCTYYICAHARLEGSHELVHNGGHIGTFL